MIKKISSIILPALLLLFTSGAISQVTISGPSCVVPDVVYQYKITSAWDSASVMQICVNGGSIADSSISRNCSDTSAPLAAVLIVWNDLSNASLTVNSSKGNKTFAVNITSPLQPGSLDSASRVQTIYDTTTTPATIYCAVDSGGSCTPGYAYQWQRSADALVWTDVSGATGQNLSFTDAVKKTWYYRRRVTETVSNTIGYSDIAIVNVNQYMAQADSSSGGDSTTGMIKTKFHGITANDLAAHYYINEPYGNRQNVYMLKPEPIKQ